LKSDLCKFLFPFFSNVFSFFKFRASGFVKVMAKLVEEDMRKKKKTHKGDMYPPTWGLSQDLIYIQLNTCRLSLPALPIKTEYLRYWMFSTPAQEFLAAVLAWQLQLAR